MDDREHSPQAAWQRPPAVEALIGRLIDVRIRAQRLAQVWDSLERRLKLSPPLERFQEVYAPPPEPGDDRLEIENRRARIHRDDRRWTQSFDEVVVAARHLRAAIDAAQDTVPSVARWTNKEYEPAISWWTTLLLRELRALRSAIAGTGPCDVPPVGGGVPPELEGVYGLLHERITAIKDIRADLVTIASPSSPTPSMPTPTAGAGAFDPRVQQAHGGFIPRDVHLTILAELAGRGVPVKASALAGLSGMPAHDHLLTLLGELERAAPAMVCRPHGEKSGWAATPEALAELKRRGLKD